MTMSVGTTTNIDKLLESDQIGLHSFDCKDLVSNSHSFKSNYLLILDFTPKHRTDLIPHDKFHKFTILIAFLKLSLSKTRVFCILFLRNVSRVFVFENSVLSVYLVEIPRNVTLFMSLRHTKFITFVS